MEKHRRIGFPENPEYVAELRAAPQFHWQEFIAGLVPIYQDARHSLKDLLESLTVSPSVYWYPGSGDDFRPLVLDVPNNAVGRRLFRTTCPDLHKDPVVFWMNDYSNYYADFPRYETQSSETPYPNRWLSEERKAREEHQWDQWFGWGRYESKLAIAERVERYVFRERLPVTLFTVNVKNRDQREHDRPEGGDTYLGIFSNVPSHVLFEEAILPMRLNVSCVLLSKQGGFAGEIFHYNQYEEIPALLRTFEPELGPVDLFLIDMNGQDEETKTPRFDSIKDYQYVGGPVRLGWQPCRAYARPGLRYQLKKKTSGYVAKKLPW